MLSTAKRRLTPFFAVTSKVVPLATASALSVACQQPFGSERSISSVQRAFVQRPCHLWSSRPLLPGWRSLEEVTSVRVSFSASVICVLAGRSVTWLPSLIPKASLIVSDMRAGLALGDAPILSAALQTMPHPTTAPWSFTISQGSLKVSPACWMASGARWMRNAPSKPVAVPQGLVSNVSSLRICLGMMPTHRGCYGRRTPCWTCGGHIAEGRGRRWPDTADLAIRQAAARPPSPGRSDRRSSTSDDDATAHTVVTYATRASPPSSPPASPRTTSRAPA